MERMLPARETVDLRSYARLLWRRKWVVVIPTILAAITAVIVTLPAIMKPVYQSSSTLMVEFPQALSRDLANLVSNPGVDEQLARLESMIQSNEFLQRVIANTGLRDDPAIRQWAKRNQKRYPDLSLDELVDVKLIEYLRAMIRMSGQQGRGRTSGNIIQVAVQDYYPDRARRLVQNITSGIIEANRSEELRQVKSTGDFSATQLQEYQAKVQQAEDRIEAYKKQQLQRRSELGLVRDDNAQAARELRASAAADLARRGSEAEEAGRQLATAGRSLGSLERLLSQGEVASRLGALRGAESDYVRQTLLEAGSNEHLSQATAMQVERGIEETRGILEPKLAGLRDLPAGQRDAAEEYLLAVIRRDLARARVEAYDGQINRYLGFVTSMPQVDLEFQRLQADLESYRSLQNAFVQQVASSQISEAFGASKVGEKISILEPAQRPLAPIRPKRAQIIILALFAGTVLGMTGAFFLEHHDPSFKDVRDVEQELSLRVLGTLPQLREVEAIGRRSPRRPGTPLRAATVEKMVDSFLADSPGYMELRKVILGLFHGTEVGPRSIMVTSARKGEGKSTTASCLALTLARERPGERIVLVDLDLHNSSLAGFFGINGKPAENGAEPPSSEPPSAEPRSSEPPSSKPHASELCSSDLAEALRELPVPNLRLLDPSRVRFDAGGILTRDGVRSLLAALAPLADRVVLDTPPNLPTPDPLVIGQQVDAVLVVVKAGSTPRETVRRGVELQRRFRDNLKGIIMNDATEVLPYYYSPRYYGYYGHGQARRGRS